LCVKSGNVDLVKGLKTVENVRIINAISL